MLNFFNLIFWIDGREVVFVASGRDYFYDVAIRLKSVRSTGGLVSHRIEALTTFPWKLSFSFFRKIHGDPGYHPATPVPE
ncbi:MAG: hypothetical protein JW801_03550 [Bacteroidales bacterium]|nr:hypothetical protein [Bacteroidales bacterium]